MSRIVAASVALAAIAGAASGGEPPARITATYACSPAMSVTAVYDNAAGAYGKADVTVGGRTYRMDQVMSASGAKYTAQHGPH